MSAHFYHSDLKEALPNPALAALRAWDGAGGPFARLDWFVRLAKSAPGARLYVAEADGAHAALPLMRGGSGELAGLANWYSFTFRPLGTPALADDLARGLRRLTHRLTLHQLPEADAHAFTAALRRAGWVAIVEPCDENHFIRVEGRSFTEYWASRPGALRETVRRKGRKGAVALRIAATFNSADWAAYEAIYALSWKPGEGDPVLLRAFAEAEGAAGRLRLGIATIAGKPAAAQFWTVEDGTAYIHKLAHDEAARALSPGTLLSAALFEHAIDVDRVQEIDFGTGSDRYKRDWMDAVRQRYRIEAFVPTAPAVWPALARRIARHVVEMMRARCGVVAAPVAV